MSAGTWRCDNCGWSNPQNAERCMKCNQENTHTSERVVSNVPSNENLHSAGAGSHIITCKKCGYPKLDDIAICPNCGASHSDSSDTTESAENKLPNQFKRESTSATVIFSDSSNVAAQSPSYPNTKRTMRDTNITPSAMKATVRDISSSNILQPKEVIPEKILKQEKDDLSLVLVDGFDNDVPKKIVCEIPSFILNRNNLDPANASISESAQAELSNENGEWYIRNLSEQNNTYIQINRKIRIEKGDVIIIGNRRYILQ